MCVQHQALRWLKTIKKLSVCVHFLTSLRRCMKYPRWGYVVVFRHAGIAVLKPEPSVPRSNVKQLVVNSLLASQSRNHEANNITVVKIYCVSTRQSQIPH